MKKQRAQKRAQDDILAYKKEVRNQNQGRGAKSRELGIDDKRKNRGETNGSRKKEEVGR